MHSIKTTLLGIVTATSVLAPIADADAWVAAARGWGGRGAVAVGGYHGAYYHGGGCWGCGAAAGAVAGLAVGAAVGAAAASAARPATVVVQQPAYYPPVSPYYPQGNLALGTQVAYLPPGSTAWWSTASTITNRARLGTSLTTDRAASITKSFPLPDPFERLERDEKRVVDACIGRIDCRNVLRPRFCAGAAEETQHPRHLGRRHRHPQHQRLQPRPDGLPHAQHRPHRQGRRALHRRLCAAELHRRAGRRSSSASTRSAPAC